MKKNISTILAAVFAAFGLTFSAVALAADPFFIEGAVEVKPGCEVTDTDGKVHTFPKEDSPGKFLGICAIVEAKDEDIINEFSFIDFGFGLFLDSINGVKTSGDWDMSWSLYHNGDSASVGLDSLKIAEGDTISLIYTSYSTGSEFDKLILHLSLFSDPPSSTGSVSSAGVAQHSFSPEKAIKYLAGRQAVDGSIDNELFTDWAAIAFGAVSPEHEAVPALKNYFINNPDPGESLGPPVLSWTRRAMALMALGINPYSGTTINYIQKIVEAFDGEQIGDTKLVNDDIFALLVLRRAGFEPSDTIVQKTSNFILNNQKPDGSWPGGVDMTAAAIQTLSLVSDIEGTTDAIAKAKAYLQSQQQVDGGFGNPEATSWVLQAIAALGEDWKEWKKGENSPGSYLFHLQRMDGSLLSSQPVWSTAYAVPAAKGLPWGDILNFFQKEEVAARELKFPVLKRIAKAVGKLGEYIEILQAAVAALVDNSTK